MQHKLNAIEHHCEHCAQCFNHLMLRLNDTPPDSSLCFSGRQLMPRIGSNGVALPISESEDGVNFAIRARGMVAR